MPKVSVIIPTYNRAHCIERALQSVQNQTFENCEVLVCDDASTDSTRDIVRDYQERDARIRLLCLSENQGPGAARNLGMEAARGEYIAFLDSDDEWLPNKIEKQVALMETLSEQWGVCHTGARIVRNEGAETLFRPRPHKNGEALREFLAGRIHFLTPTVMIRRSIIKTVGFFDERLWRAQDAEFLFRAFRLFRLAVLPEVSAVVHLDSTKVHSPAFAGRFESSRLTFLQKHEKTIRCELGFYSARRFRGNNFWLIADAKFSAGEFSSGVRYFLRAVAVFPLVSPRRYARMLASAMGLTRLVRRVRVHRERSSR